MSDARYDLPEIPWQMKERMEMVSTKELILVGLGATMTTDMGLAIGKYARSLLAQRTPAQMPGQAKPG
jgi:hypothetical protein